MIGMADATQATESGQVKLEHEAAEGFGIDLTPGASVELCPRCTGVESSDDLCLSCHMAVFG